MIEGQPVWFSWDLLVKIEYFCPICQYSINYTKLTWFLVWESPDNQDEWTINDMHRQKCMGRKLQKIWLIALHLATVSALKVFNQHKPESQVEQAQLSREKGNKKVFGHQHNSVVPHCLGLKDNRNHHFLGVRPTAVLRESFLPFSQLCKA